MKSYYKDTVVGLTFMAGVFSFISGGFILSSALFAVTAITSNLKVNHIDNARGC